MNEYEKNCTHRGVCKWAPLNCSERCNEYSNRKDTLSEFIEGMSGHRKRPTVVCLCGSTRFSEAFRNANFSETLAGRIVLTIGCDFKSDEDLHLSNGDKERLDELHKRKIDLADEVLILNVGDYIGKSTKSELEYAKQHGKRIRYLELHGEEGRLQGPVFVKDE
jgi:hypothetical protein